MAVQDTPNPIQVEDMIKFVGEHKNVFIYGCCENQVLLAKFFKSAGITVNGLLVDYDNQVIESTLPVYTLERAKNIVASKKFLYKRSRVRDDTCVVISNEDWMFNWTYKQLKKYGFNEIYVLSEWNKRTIPHKMKPRTKDRFCLEVILVDHCNLNCQCCDHFPPLLISICWILKNLNVI